MPKSANIKQRGRPFEAGNEAQQSGKKGGKASGKARRIKRTLRETLSSMMDMEGSKGKTVIECITLALIREAIHGNTKAYEIIRDMLGEKPDTTITVAKAPDYSVLDNAFELLKNTHQPVDNSDKLGEKEEEMCRMDGKPTAAGADSAE